MTSSQETLNPKPNKEQYSLAVPPLPTASPPKGDDETLAVKTKSVLVPLGAGQRPGETRTSDDSGLTSRTSNLSNLRTLSNLSMGLSVKRAEPFQPVARDWGLGIRKPKTPNPKPNLRTLRNLSDLFPYHFH